MNHNESAAALGFRAHSGWAALVAVAGTPQSGQVLLRRRIELADPKVPGSKQPYHAAEGEKFPKAEKIIGRLRRRRPAPRRKSLR